MRVLILLILLLAAAAGRAESALDQWPTPVTPAVQSAFPWVVIPNAALPPQAKHVYRAIFDAKNGVENPKQPLVVLSMAGSVLNGIAAAGGKPGLSRFAIVFHDDSLDGILDDAHYRAKFEVANPNLKLLAELRAAGVELFVCGQNLYFAHVDPKSLSPLVTIASSALFVLMRYQADGYVLLTY